MNSAETNLELFWMRSYQRQMSLRRRPDRPYGASIHSSLSSFGGVQAEKFQRKPKNSCFLVFLPQWMPGDGLIGFFFTLVDSVEDITDKEKFRALLGHKLTQMINKLDFFSPILEILCNLCSNQMNVAAIFGVDEYCMANAGEIDWLVEFKDMNLRVNQTFLKAINSFISVVVRAPSLILMQERVNIGTMWKKFRFH